MSFLKPKKIEYGNEIEMNWTRQPLQEACQQKAIRRWDSFSVTNFSKARKREW
jgi:hypothetical protein